MAASDIKVVADFTDLQLMRRELVGVSKDAKTSAGVFEREFNKVSRALSISAKSTQVFYNSTLKVDRVAKSAATSAKVFEAALKQHDATLKKVALSNRRLRMEYKEGYAAQVQLRAEQMRLSAAFRRGVISSDEYKLALGRLGNTATVAGKQVQLSGRKMSSGGVAIQQLGYQAGDFFVQIQSGTNAMVAFGQQATQLVGVLPMVHKQFGLTLGAAVGLSAGLGIAIPILTAIGGYFMRTRKTAKGLEDGLEDLSSAVSAYSSFVNTATMDTQELSSKFGDVGEEASDVAKFLASWAKVDAVRKMNVAVVALTDEFGGLNGQMQDVTNQSRALVDSILGEGVTQFSLPMLDTISDLSAEFGIATQDAYQLVSSMQALSDAEGVNAQVSATVDLHNQFLAVFGTIENIPEELAEVARQAGLIALKAGEINGEVSDVSDNFGKVTWEINESVNAAVRLRDVMADVGKASLSMSDKATILRSQITAARSGQNVSGAGARTETALELARGGATADEIARVAMEAGNAATLVDTLEKELADLLKSDSSKSGKGSSATIKETNLEKLREELNLMEELRGKTEEYTFVRQKLGDQYKEVGQETIDRLQAEYAGIQSLIDLEKQREQLMTGIGQSIADGFTAMVEGTMTVKDAFRNMAKEIIKQLWEIFVVQQIVGVVSQAFGVPKAVTDPAVSAMMSTWDGGGYTGSGARSGGMDGKGGFVAMLHPQETVVDHTKGQSTGGGQSVVINQSFNFSANGDDSVKKIIAQAAPQIAQMTQKSMMDQRRRGGSMKSTFG